MSCHLAVWGTRVWQSIYGTYFSCNLSPNEHLQHTLCCGFLYLLSVIIEQNMKNNNALWNSSAVSFRFSILPALNLLYWLVKHIIKCFCRSHWPLNQSLKNKKKWINIFYTWSWKSKIWQNEIKLAPTFSPNMAGQKSPCQGLCDPKLGWDYLKFFLL